MAYYANINIDKYPNHIPDVLKYHMKTAKVEDVGIEYHLPEIKPLKADSPAEQTISDNINSVRIPARINNPLIPYPAEVKGYIVGEYEIPPIRIHAHHKHNIDKLMRLTTLFSKEWFNTNPEYRFDINYLKSVCDNQFSHRSAVIHQTATAFAKRATQHEITMMAKTEIKPNHPIQSTSRYISLLVAIHRLRTYLGRADKSNTIAVDSSIVSEDEPVFKMFDDYSYFYGTSNEKYTLILLVSGGHFSLLTGNSTEWFFGPIVYLDYMFTVADILNNLSVIKMMDEYKWVVSFLNIMEELLSPQVDHNVAVEFMKGLEGYLLNLSDYDEQYVMNWKPILEISHDLWKLDQVISSVHYPYEVLIACMSGKPTHHPKQSVLCKLTVSAVKMTRNEMQEASALHKFIFYAEVDAQAGVKKFLKRVHTPRPVDQRAIQDMISLAKKEFFQSYCKKHNIIPNLRGSEQKIIWLKMMNNRNNNSDIDALPLSWWRDIEIFNCMDNTLTDDALEFAKDKGALKSEIHLGPGDSRKELLQVIEQKDYRLKDFFAQGPFIPKPVNVYSTHRHRQAFPSAHPARLIEKEREQKEEARLFANGELSDKHALSVITTKMKKALSYFDEQLMTPPDKTRKLILHNAAQSLIDSENYSLLLDIEGHNQSMQATNTADLARFCGQLFGFDDWGTLPDYFSQLDVYHYDEYMDKVILSQGQLGGIEGWLNPLWTMHTMLCIKLIRYMTSIELVTSMTYSDDVNAIIRLPQASEESLQGTFSTIMQHFIKFGMITKVSQTSISKHRVTMLRQHYADGVRSDSTLKKLISTSGANNSMIVSDSIEVAGISSSIASALEMSNHVFTCTYLKNYKLGLLLSRLPHMLLSRAEEGSILDKESLPSKLSSLLHHVKDDKSYLLGENYDRSIDSTRNDIARYLRLSKGNVKATTVKELIRDMLGPNLSDQRFLDSPDRVLYLQLYDVFLQDLQFFWIYMPESLGGLGGSLTLNLFLSGHSSGMSKSLHYLKEWITTSSSNQNYFMKYLNYALTIDDKHEMNLEEDRLLTSYWPSERTITSATSSINAALKSMINMRKKNVNVIKLLDLGKEAESLRKNMICIFRDNYHPRIAQFYYENTSVHFIDLLVNKIETSSGLLSFIRSLSRLRNSLCKRALENIRTMSRPRTSYHGVLRVEDDIIEKLLLRRQSMFPKVSMISVDEPLYDDKLEEIVEGRSMFTCRQCSPQHFDEGRRIYDNPDFGNEIHYKGEYIDEDRMIGNKEELIAAKLVAVTKWILTKFGFSPSLLEEFEQLDCVLACNTSLSTLTGQTLLELWNFSPNEVGGEILHRIPNMRFNQSTYLRSDLSRSLRYTVDMNQNMITNMDLIDSNVNFDYVRMRILLAAIIRDLNEESRSFKMEWKFKSVTTFVDVQFVKPKRSGCSMTNVYTCYATFRGHVFSELRYRYLATRYLNSEDMLDLALIPNLLQTETSLQLGVDLMQELIYNYSLSLDRDYMKIRPTDVSLSLWKPLIGKLKGVNTDFATMTEAEQVSTIKTHLTDILNKRRRITTVSKSDPGAISMQSQCLTYLDTYRPKNILHSALVKRYGKMMKVMSHTRALSIATAKFKNILEECEEYKRQLGIVLLCEYVLTYHFVTNKKSGNFYYDATKSYNEFLKLGLLKISVDLINPTLYIQLMIVGIDYLETLAMMGQTEIRNVLHEISQFNNMADIIMPQNLPNLKGESILTGDEYLQQTVAQVYYSMDPIPYDAMATMDEIKPLLRFARKCVDVGASPEIYESPTGSDSYIAQLGLFDLLKDKIPIDRNIKICDLTAGRGDFQYVCKSLNLSADSYGIRDTFTGVYFHPNVDYTKQYDLRDMKSIKFIRDYDWVHIDISFTGKDDMNVLDLILSIEELNIGYSLRLNSVSLAGYSGSVLEGLPNYNHYICSPMNSHLKPYQVYLVGVPGDETLNMLETTMKKTAAFRSIALSYSRLLNPKTRSLRLYDHQPNSVSILLQDNIDFRDLLKEIGSDTQDENQIFYLNRYVAEVEDDGIIYFREDSFEENSYKNIAAFIDYSNDVTSPVYIDKSLDDIGKVSEKSYPYKKSHLENMQSEGPVKKSIDIHHQNIDVLIFFRAMHPLHSVRVSCNIMIHLKQVLPGYDIATRDNILRLTNDMELVSRPRNTLHQQEYQLALKLLVLAASSDNYLFGPQYCHEMISRGPEKERFYVSVLKIYRCISFLYEDTLDLVNSGGLSVRYIHAIRYDVIDRVIERTKYREKGREDVPKMIEPMTHTGFDLIKFDTLFEDLEKFANQATEDLVADDNFKDFEELIEPHELTFDININEQVELFLAANPDLPMNRFGMIDLGDDDMDYDPDLM